MQPCALVAVTASALLCATASAQNLLKWDAWVNTHPQTQKVYATQTGLSFGIPCGLGNCNHSLLSGVKQTVTVPSDGLYQMNLSGWGAKDGSARFIATVGQHTVSDNHEFVLFAIADAFYLRAGSVEVVLLTGPDVVNQAIHMDQPTLAPAIVPTVDIDLGSGFEYVHGWIRARANILAASLGTPSKPITIPSMTHGLDLDPTSLVILGTSVFGDIQKYIAVPRGSSQFPPRIPRIYVQAATWQGFGSGGWLGPW